MIFINVSSPIFGFGRKTCKKGSLPSMSSHPNISISPGRSIGVMASMYGVKAAGSPSAARARSDVGSIGGGSGRFPVVVYELK